MGIDAEMLIRGVRREIVTDEWLKTISWQLCRAIGASKFFISDGLMPDEYEKANKAWHKAFNEHKLYQQFTAEKDSDNRTLLRKQIIEDIGEVPEARRLAIEPTNTHYRDEGDKIPGTEYYQDGDTIEGEPWECLLRVHLWGRYYGIGYERGDILTYCAIAEWIEVNIPGCTIYYGGDSSGVCAEPFDARARLALRRHLYSQQGRDYFNYGNAFPNDFTIKPPPCGLCPGDQFLGTRFGWGQDYAAYSCGGCGKTFETRDKGKTWETKKDE